LSDKLISRDEVSELLGGISLTTLWRLTYVYCHLKPVTVGMRRTCYRQSDVQKYIEAHGRRKVISNV
jgi:predicted DNA-binding transcriptional regulator AlpA